MAKRSTLSFPKFSSKRSCNPSLSFSFARQTPQAIWADIQSGRIASLKSVLAVWTKTPLWNPPRQDQALQQGGVVVFEGHIPVWVHRDPATGAHADLEEVVRVATLGL